MSIKLSNGARAQIELDYIEYNRELLQFIEEHSEEEKLNRPSRPTDRELLDKVLKHTENYPDEKDVLLDYQSTLLQFQQKQQELDSLSSDKNLILSKSQLDVFLLELTSQRNILQQKLIELENSSQLQNVIEREYQNILKEYTKQSMPYWKARFEIHKSKEKEAQQKQYEEMMLRIKQRKETEAQQSQETSTDPVKKESIFNSLFYLFFGYGCLMGWIIPLVFIIFAFVGVWKVCDGNIEMFLLNVFCAPFALLGAFNLVRGFFNILEEDSYKFEKDWKYLLYFVANILGCLAVALALFQWFKSL